MSYVIKMSPEKLREKINEYIKNHKDDKEGNINLENMLMFLQKEEFTFSDGFNMIGNDCSDIILKYVDNKIGYWTRLSNEFNRARALEYEHNKKLDKK